MFKEYDVVKSRIRLNDKVPKDTIGTILVIYSDQAFEVEFINDKGDTLDIVTVKKSNITIAERLH